VPGAWYVDVQLPARAELTWQERAKVTADVGPKAETPPAVLSTLPLNELMTWRSEKVLEHGPFPDPFPRCGGCGTRPPVALELVHDKKRNRGLLCPDCAKLYAELLLPDSARNFWMCGECGFRILAGTRIDAAVDPDSLCPNCRTDVNRSLVNLSGDAPIGTDLLGHPAD
jgi:hypothetical protein